MTVFKIVRKIGAHVTSASMPGKICTLLRGRGLTELFGP